MVVSGLQIKVEISNGISIPKYMARKEKKNGENGGNDETDERGYLTPKIIIKMPSSNKRKK